MSHLDTITRDRLIKIWQTVLGRADIGVHDDFFELGGDSISGAQVVARIAEELQIAISIFHLFRNPTIAGLEECLESDGEPAKPGLSPLGQLPRPEHLPLAYAQQRLWFMAQMEGGSRAYHMGAGFRLRGALNVAALECALDRIVARHEPLRTTFAAVEGQPVQRIAEDGSFQLLKHDLRGQDELELLRLVEKEADEPFDLETGPLIRGRLVRTGEQQHVLLITMHHIVSDGWSMGVLVEELSALYRAYGEEEDPLPELKAQYVDYSIWQRAWMEGEVLQRQAEYWKNAMASAPALLTLPADQERPAEQDYAGALVEFTLEEELTAGLAELGKAHGTTMYMTLLAGWAALLGRLSGQEEVVIGTPTANRGRSEIEKLIGCFINTLAVRVKLSGEPTVAELLERVKVQTLDGQQHQDLPFEHVVELLQPVRSLAHSPLFQVMFAWQNTPGAKLNLPGVEVEELHLARMTTKFDLTLSLRSAGRKIVGGVTYATALFKRETVERYVGYLRTLLRAMVAGEAQLVERLPLLSEEERRRVLEEFNGTAADYPRERCVHELFEAQAEKDPRAPAVVYQEKEYSYGELNRRANQLAHYLRGMGVGAETRVALCCERSLEMIVGVLGVWKAGGAYVPLDCHHPGERLGYLLEDAGAEVVLTEESVRAALPAGSARVVSLDGDWRRIARESEHNPGKLTGPQNLAYVIYTSGSTGQPKGVMVEHGSVVNLFFALRDRVYGGVESGGLRVAVNGPVTFDTSVKQIVQLLAGHALDIVPEEVRRDGEALLRYVRERGIEALDCTPSQLRLLLEAGLVEEKQEKRGEQQGGKNPRLVLVGGEAIEEDLWKRVSESEIRFFNVYGPTECTVDAAVCAIRGESAAQTIGRPIANTQIYILDQHNQPQPVGVAGELHIAGEGVARGYLNRGEQTEQKFVANPFAAGGRMYKTGDRARWLEDGSIQYLGRMDTQVKVRGYRIELGEIEARLNQHPGIEESVVIARGEDVHKQLIAFYRAKESGAGGEEEQGQGKGQGQEIGQEELRRHVMRSLPDYMVPAGFERVEVIPLTANGKVDRRALERREVKLAGGRQYVGPRNESEREMVGIWAEVLQLEAEKIGVEDNFFELGGHSLLATQVMAKMRSRLGMEWPLKVLFERPSVGQLAEWMAGGAESGAAAAAIVPVERSGLERLPLSYAQERLWFLQQMEPDSAGYNVPLAVRVAGELDIAQLEQAFAVIIARHENLRTVFPSQEGQAQQVIVEVERLDFKLEYHDASPWPEEEERERRVRELCQAAAAKPFDLARGPLLRGQVIKLAEREHVLMLTLHHIISDGWSVGVLLRELDSILGAWERGEAVPLPALPIQYADYSVWQRSRLEQEGVLERQLGYWEKKLEGVAESLDLATDYPRPRVQDWAGATHRFVLDGELTEGLKSLGGRQGGTLYMVLLAAFQTLLYRYSGQNDICVGSPIANRQYAETEGLIGMFVNTLAMRSRVEGEESFSGLLGQVKATCLEAYENQDAPFEKVVERLQPERNLGMSPIFQVMVVLQNAGSGKERKEAERFRRYRLQTGISKFDLTAVFRESEEGLTASLRYRSGLYKRETMERMAGHFTALCRAIVAMPEARIGELDYLNPRERRRVLEEFNGTAADYPRERCVHELFEAQAERQPEETAVVCGEERWSYGQLHEQSRALALYLQAQGVGPECVVAVCMERSVELVVAVLGILQAGGAYVPLDPAYPEERLAYMLRDSRAALVLTQDNLRERLQALIPADTRLLAIDGDGQWPEISACVVELKANHVQLERQVRPHHLAYVIYTSGSTGQPKGVAIEHHSSVTLVQWATTLYSREELAGVLAATSICFDLSVYEIFVTLACGGKIILVPNALSLVDLPEQERESVTLINTVPSAMEELVRLGAIPNSVRTINLAGEPLSATLVDKIYDTTTVEKVYDLYGPSEDTTYSTYALRKKHGLPTIGRPISNTQIYILDGNNQPQPIGVPGELHIAGDGLARGYLHRPELTHAKFVANPFAAGTRMYKTGDRARWLEDGSLQYLGRMDTQVKLRGYRIELGEIEARLCEHPLVRQAVVVLSENEQEEKQLVAYFVPVSEDTEDGSAEGKTKDASELIRDLRAHLTPRLPSYMVPAAFVKLDALPLTPNGKLDRKRLPLPTADGHEVQAYEAPVGNVETVLASIWEEVLKIQKIGRRDNFFALGGHSLLTLRLVNNLERKGINISALDIFKHATLESLAAKVEFEGRQISRDRAISLRSGGSELPLFLTHDGSAQLIYVPALAPYIDLDIPLYGLPAIPAYEPQLQTIEEMATRMAKMIRAVQPAGPYRIAGWSFGGLTAFEVAAQLALAGEKVEFIGLIDTYYPTPNRTSVNGCRKDFDDKKQLLSSLEVMIRHRPEFNEDQRIQVTDELHSLAARADFEALAEKCRKIGLMPSRWVDLTPVQLSQTLARMHAHKVAGSQYSASRITVPMHIFHAEDDNTSPWLGWNTVFSTSQIRVVDVPGTHLTIMEKPNIASLGQALSNAIRSTAGDLSTGIENGNASLLPLQMG
jgi:amino acid adenylation domain-containing protein